MQWIFLATAIVLEVCATLSLRLASSGRRLWWVAVVAGYLSAFTFLTLTLDAGLGLGVAYGIWTAAGVAITAVASWVLFNEPLTGPMMGGILLIIGGVFLVELGATH